MTKSFMKELEGKWVYGSSITKAISKKIKVNLTWKDMNKDMKLIQLKTIKQTLSKKKKDILEEIDKLKIDDNFGLIKSKQIIKKHLK